MLASIYKHTFFEFSILTGLVDNYGRKEAPKRGRLVVYLVNIYCTAKARTAFERLIICLGMQGYPLDSSLVL